MDDGAPAEGRQGGIDPLQVLDDGRSHPDTVQVGDGIGGHGGLLVVSVMRPARRLAPRSGALRPWSITSQVIGRQIFRLLVCPHWSRPLYPLSASCRAARAAAAVPASPTSRSVPRYRRCTRPLARPSTPRTTGPA